MIKTLYRLPWERHCLPWKRHWRHIVLGTLFIVLLSLPLSLAFASEAPSSALQPTSSISLPKTVELALIVAALTPIGLEQGHTIDRSSAYFREVEAYFGAYRSHHAVAMLGAEFSLPRLVGNAADFAFDPSGKLTRVDNSGALWGDSAGDLFAQHQIALAHFARITDFESFYHRHQATYTALITATQMATQLEQQRAWLEAHFDARPGPSKVFVSPLLSGHHWTTLYKAEPRIWLSAPKLDDMITPDSRLRYARKLFTEVSHQYVNPLTDVLADSVAQAMADNAVWRAPGANSYNSSLLRFNEYMTWAAFILYAADSSDALGKHAFKILVEEISQTMVHRRGFVAFAPFAKEALLRYRQGETASMIQRAMVAWARGYSSGYRDHRLNAPIN